VAFIFDFAGPIPLPPGEREPTIHPSLEGRVISTDNFKWHKPPEHLSTYCKIMKHTVSKKKQLSHSGFSGMIFLRTKRDSRQAGMTRNEDIQLMHATVFGFWIRLFS
jgi:hypothetical protein